MAQSAKSLFSRLSYGVTGGIELTGNGSDSITHYESRRYAIGPSVEFGISDRVGIQFNPLYRRLGYSQFFGKNAPLVTSFDRNRTNEWQFPVIGKYYWGNRERVWRIFTGAGYAWETEGRTTYAAVTVIDPMTERPVTTSGNGYVRSTNWAGSVFEGGVQIQKARLRFAPEFRYTHWGGGGTGLVNRNRNQSEFLLNIHF